jgi:hypothetical protein
MPTPPRNWWRGSAPAFVCAGLALTPDIREDHAAYIGHRLKVPKNYKRAIFPAASHADRAADFLNGLAANPAAAVSTTRTRGSVPPAEGVGVPCRSTVDTAPRVDKPASRVSCHW